MNRFFTYTIPVDDGAAPNPFGSICTLAICKPAIRRTATVGDWVAGFGSKNAPSGDLRGKLVYAMKVTKICTLAEYDRLAPTHWPNKIPDMLSRELCRRLGDCIYDYSRNPPRQRPGVHGLRNVVKDLRGRNVLISNHFYYFGREAIAIPDGLKPILHQTQGHKSRANAPYFDRFVAWITSQGFEMGQLYGWPDYIPSWTGGCKCTCSARRRTGGNNRESPC